MAENNSNQKQQLKEITERLEQGVKDLFSSEKYMEYLRVMSQFHNYSFSNTLLIAMQKPDATLVAGYGAWQKKFERNVMKGEKAIKIFAPTPRKVEMERDMIDPDTKLPVLDENGEVQKEKVTVQQPHFKIASVFDVSQTDGKPLPELDTVHDLTADVEGYSIFFEALKRTSKVPMDFEPIEGGSHGFYHQTEKRIAIAEGMSEAQNVKTGIHEIAHSRLHDRDMIDAENGIMVDRRTREVQAESVAYTVCQHYGIETSEYSFGYIAGWSEGKELKELRSSMEVIRREADSMITEIDKHMEDIRREREQEVEVVAEVFIASYYVVEDFDVEGAPIYHKFDDLDSALQAYFAFPNDKTKALGIENANAQKVDMMTCINGIDHTVYYHMKVEGWNIPEVTEVADRAFAAIQSHDTSVAYQNDNGFVAIQTTDGGYDYTFYNDQFEVLDGGVLDDPDLTVREAIDSILEDEGQSFTDCTVVNYDWLMEKAEAAEMGLIEQIGSKVQEPKVSMEDVKALLAASHNQEADLFEASKTAFPDKNGATLYDNLYGAAVDKLREDADTLDVVELFGKEALFTNGRVTKNALPEGLYTYDLRGSDDDPGQPVTLEPMVLVNHAASVIVSDKIPIPENGVVPLGEDMSFTGDSITMEQFYDNVTPGKGAMVYHKDASDIAEKAVRTYLGNPDTMDHLGDRREAILSSITDKLSETYLAVGNTVKSKEQTIPPMSKLTFTQAKEQNKVDEWRASRKATENCSQEFDEKFGMAYHERRMPEFLSEMTEKYGMERCMVVLASTIQLADHDGRYYPSTKADAAKVEIPGANTEDYSKDIRMSYRVNCHPVMVNSAFRVLQQMQREQSQEKQAAAEKKSSVEQDAKAPKPSLLNRLHDKQKEASNMSKQNPAKAQDKKRGVEI